MANIINMPKMGNTVEECLLGQWNVKVGQEIKVGDVLFTYETDKTEVEEKSQFSGYILKILVDEGDEVPIFTPVLIIGEKDEDISQILETLEVNLTHKDSLNNDNQVENVINSHDTAKQVSSGKVNISPRAKKVADEYDINITDIEFASGVNKRIISTDVTNKYYSIEDNYEKIKNNEIITNNEITKVPYNAVRKAIKKSVRSSLENSAQVTASRSFDATKIFNLRQKIKQARNNGVTNIENSTINDFIMYALSRTAMEFPVVNSTSYENHYELHNYCNIGVAVDNGSGLYVPVIKSVDKLTLGQITKQTTKIVNDIKENKIDSSLFKGGTITISNVGNTGVEMFTPIISQPQSSIIGVGSAILRPKYDDNNNIVLFKSIMLSLTFNHDTYDGALAAQFLNKLAYNLENIDLVMLG